MRPALQALAGETPARERTVATLDTDCRRAPARVEAVRCRLRLRPDGWHVTPTGVQDSHILTSLLGADALALIPAGTGVLAAGERVIGLRLAGLLLGFGGVAWLVGLHPSCSETTGRQRRGGRQITAGQPG